MPASRSITFERPGLLTLVQDLGRPGMARFGVQPGGAMDRAALIAGNRLLGNDPGAAALECTLNGPAIRFSAETVFAVTGADFAATLNGRPIPRWQPVIAPAGALLSLGNAQAGSGMRAYVCFAGGIDVPVVLGGRSTDTTGGFGGQFGRQLAEGDALALGEPALPTEELLLRRWALPLPEYPDRQAIRVVLGPQTARFTEAGIATFLSGAYRVSTKADRTGIRLEGPAIAHIDNADLVSEGIAHGAIQVPGDGQPIVLMASRGTVGGYTKIATVIGGDLDRLGQVRPGQSISFTAIDINEARALTRAYLEQLGEAAITTVDEGDESLSEWNPVGVARVIAEAERAGVTYLKLEVASAGVSLEISRSGASLRSTSSAAPPAEAPVSAPDGAIDVIAPVLGTFYRRRSPGEAPLVEAGCVVKQGALLGLIEVMKTYHEVNAPADGTVTEILIEDGHYVEYGQPLFRFSPAG